MRVEESSQVASFILWWFLFQRGGFLHSACAAVGMTYLRGGFVYPHRLYLQRPRNGTQAVPYGFAGRWILSATRVVFGTWYGDGSSPLHCVTPFNHTGCICNVAGGRLPKKSWCDCHRQSIDFDSLRGAPPLQTRRWVVPFNRTGCIRNVAWYRLGRGFSST